MKNKVAEIVLRDNIRTKEYKISTIESYAIELKYFKVILNTKLNLVSLPHSGDWLLVVPSPSLGLQLKDGEFRNSALYHLGMPVFEFDGSCEACGAGFSDEFGDHAIGCASQGERIAHHNHLRDTLYHTAMGEYT